MFVGQTISFSFVGSVIIEAWKLRNGSTFLVFRTKLVIGAINVNGTS